MHHHPYTAREIRAELDAIECEAAQFGAYSPAQIARSLELQDLLQRPPRLAAALDAISDERIDDVYARAQSEHRGQP